MKDFRTLEVWKKSHQLTLRIYELTRSFPKEELYGLTSQVRRSVSSIPTNIAEACGRGSNADFQRFLQISYGSTSEVDYQLMLASDLGYLDAEMYQLLSRDLQEIQRMLASLIRKVRSEYLKADQ